MFVVSEIQHITPPPFYCSSLEQKTITETLRGMVFLDESIVLDDLGLKKYKEQNKLDYARSSDFEEGRFIALLQEKNKYVCKTDAFGQETLFYYHDGTNWAASSSLIFLAEKLKSHGVGLSVYEPAVQAFMAGNQSLFGGQLLSFRTGIKEIRLLPHNKQIEIDKTLSNRFSVKEKPESKKSIGSESGYAKSLASYVTLWRSRLKKLTEIEFLDKTMELSGGYDTRVNLAIIHAMSLKDLTVLTDNRKPDDLKSVLSLSEELGFEVRQISKLPAFSKAIIPECEFALLRYGAMGIYLPPYRMRSSEHTNVLKIHGANYRGRAYVKKPALAKIDSLVNELPREIAKSVRAEFLSSFEELGVNPQDPRAMQAHYLAFRCRLHYGKEWHWRFRNLFVTPQLSPLLKQLTDWRQSQGEHAEQVTCDILYSADPRLATLPFDAPEKAFSKEVIKKSKQLGLDFSNLAPTDIKFFGEIKIPKEDKPTEKHEGKFYDYFMRKFDIARKNKQVKQIYGKRFIKEARKQRKEASLLRTGKINAVIAAHEIVKLTE